LRIIFELLSRARIATGYAVCQATAGARVKPETVPGSPLAHARQHAAGRADPDQGPKSVSPAGGRHRREYDV